MKVHLHPCFILHQRPYRETSLILDIFSREKGRVSLVAKGVKQKKSRAGPLVRLHQKLRIAWSGKGEMGTLTDIEMDGVAYPLSGRCLLAAFYLNELLIRLLHPHEANEGLYDAYGDALETLASGIEEAALRIFEKRLVDCLGYGLILDHEVDTGAGIDDHKIYFYEFDRGPTLDRPQGKNYTELTGRTLNALNSHDLADRKVLKEAKQLLLPVLKQHIGDKPLKSRELYRAYLETIEK